jgi:hypothetical protein
MSNPTYQLRPNRPPRNPRIINVPEWSEDGEVHNFHEVHARDVEVPLDVQKALHSGGLVDYNTARALNLENLFDILTEPRTWKASS